MKRKRRKIKENTKAKPGETKDEGAGYGRLVATGGNWLTEKSDKGRNDPESVAEMIGLWIVLKERSLQWLGAERNVGRCRCDESPKATVRAVQLGGVRSMRG